MLGITVSTNYAKILDKIIKNNACYFDKWIIVTSEDDIDTLNVIENSGCNNIIILYYNFKQYYSIFNKGGAIKYAQQHAESLMLEDKRILIFDSDIYLPDNLNSLIPDNIDINTLYGFKQRCDYYSYSNFLERKVDSIYIKPAVSEFYLHWAGCFQLYNIDSCAYYTNSIDCSACDLEFSKRFTNKKIIADVIIHHLGREGVGWKGRKSYEDFLM